MYTLDDAKQELDKLEDAIAMADRAIQLSRLEQERISTSLSGSLPETAGPGSPGGES